MTETVDAWLFTGRIELIGNEDFDLPKWFPLEGFEATLIFEHPLTGEELREWQEDEWREPDEKPVRSVEFEVRIDPKGQFRFGGKQGELEWFDDIPPNVGTWDLQVDDYENPEQTKSGWMMGVSILRVIVARNLKPTVNQRRCDFGLIRLDFDALFPGRYFVAGRLVDSEGSPLCRSWFTSLIASVGESKHTFTFQTDADGRFVEEAYYENDEIPLLTTDAASWVHQYIYRLREYEQLDAHMAVDRPVLKGRVLSFGDVRIRGCVIRARVKDNRPKSGPEADRWEEFVWDTPYAHLGIDCASYLSSPELDIPYDGSESCAWLPEGVYRYGITGGNYSTYVAHQGSLVVPTSGVIHLELPLDPLPIVAVEIVPEGDPIQVTTYWDVYNGQEIVRSDLAGGLKFFLVLREGEHAVLQVQPVAYQGVEFTVRAGDGDQVIHLPGTPGRGWLRVKLPSCPEGYTWEQLDVRLSINGMRTSIYLILDDTTAAAEQTFPVYYIGTVRAYLSSGRNYGWFVEEQYIATPIEITVEKDATIDVILPEIPTPKWTHWGRGQSEPQITCGGNRVSLPRSWWPRYQTDGRDLPQVQQLAPERDGDPVRLSLELPWAVTVNAPSFVQFYGPGLFANLMTWDGSQYGSNANLPREGVCLWAPPGRAKLILRRGEHGAEVYSAYLDVLANQMVQHEAVFDSSLRKVTFASAEDEDTGVWDVYRLTDGGVLEFEFRARGFHAMAPGDYIAVPSGSFAVQDEFSFTVTDQAEQLIQLPASAAEPDVATLCIRFKLPEGDYQWSAVRWDPVLGRREYRNSQHFMDYSSAWDFSISRIVPNGINAYSFPLEAEQLVYGCVCMSRNAKLEYWLIVPQVVTLTEDRQQVQVQLQRAVPINGFYRDQIDLSDWIAGYTIQTVYGCVPIGVHTLSYTLSGESKSVVEWTTEVGVEDEFVSVPLETEEKIRSAFKAAYGHEPVDH